MSDIYKIKLKSPQALILLQQLEKFDIIQFLSKEEFPLNKKSSFNKYKGIISADEAEKMQKEITKSRKEWDERDIC